MDQFHRDIDRSDLNVTDVLSSPIGDEKFIESVFQKRNAKVGTLQEKFELLNDPHCAYSILKNFSGLAKLTYSLRNCAPSERLKTLLEKFDFLERDTSEVI